MVFLAAVLASFPSPSSRREASRRNRFSPSCQCIDDSPHCERPRWDLTRSSSSLMAPTNNGSRYKFGFPSERWASVSSIRRMSIASDFRGEELVLSGKRVLSEQMSSPRPRNHWRGPMMRIQNPSRNVGTCAGNGTMSGDACCLYVVRTCAPPQSRSRCIAASSAT